MSKMSLLFASDNNFCKVLGTSLLSVCLTNAKQIEKIYVISQNISNQGKNDLQSIVNDFDLKIDFLEMPDFNQLIGEEVDIKRYSASMFSRILISSLLPSYVKRVIYLDCDTMILGDLIDLWNFDLEGNTVGAVNDYRSVYYQRNLGILDENCYINSGVLLIDLERYRKKNYEKILVDAIKEYNGLLEFPDNDAICKILQNDIKLMPLQYNVTSIFYMTNVKELNVLRHPNIKISDDEIGEAKKNPGIVHFTTCFLMKGRPWMKGCDHPLAQKYFELYQMTPWKNEELIQVPENFNKRVKRFIVKFTPRFLLIFFCGIIHSYVKPFLQRGKLKKVRESKFEE